MPDTQTESNSVSDRLNATTEQVREVTQKLQLAARGAAGRLEDTGNELLDELVKTGEKLEKERHKQQQKKNRQAGGQKSTLDTARERLAGYLGLPTRDEVEKLSKKLNTVQRKVNKLEKAGN
jgi:polyhydroxyalkanoate synthesis regulator phasin